MQINMLSRILFIAAIVTAILSPGIDRKFNGEGKLRKVLLVFSVGVICLCLLPVLFHLL